MMIPSIGQTQILQRKIKSAQKTGLDCGMMVTCGNINNIKVTAVASDLILGASMASAEGEAFIWN